MPRDRRSLRSAIVRRSGSLAFLALVLVASCEQRPARDVTVTNAALRGPERLPPPSRTVDAAGFVDNAGRTSDERNRTELSGMRATEVGSHVPTGTPGSGLPIPIEPEARRRAPERPETDRWALGEPLPSGARTSVVARQLARAYCDREWSCGRVSVPEAWASMARCMDGIRTRFFEDLGRAPCPDALDPDLVPACLTAIRRTSCDVSIESMGAVEGCEPAALCLPR